MKKNCFLASGFFTCDIFGLIFLFYIFCHDFFLSDFPKEVILDFMSSFFV